MPAPGSGAHSRANFEPTPPEGLGDDPQLNTLADSCFAGDMQACDDLWAQSDPDSPYHTYADTCAGRQPENTGRYCTELAPVATSEPVATEPAVTQPPSTEPASTQPAVTEPPATTEPATTEPATTEPATTEPATTEPATTEPATTATTAGDPQPRPPHRPSTTATEPSHCHRSRHHCRRSRHHCRRSRHRCRRSPPRTVPTTVGCGSAAAGHAAAHRPRHRPGDGRARAVLLRRRHAGV